MDVQYEGLGMGGRHEGETLGSPGHSIGVQRRYRLLTCRPPLSNWVQGSSPRARRAHCQRLRRSRWAGRLAGCQFAVATAVRLRWRAEPLVCSSHGVTRAPQKWHRLNQCYGTSLGGRDKFGAGE
jgi:hypothetical protein